MKQLAEASLNRLKNWGISGEQLKALSKSSGTRRTLTYRSPVNGIVIEKKAVQGMRFMPGEMLYQIADLSSVWIIADVFEQDLALVKPGQTAKVKLNAYPGKANSRQADLRLSDPECTDAHRARCGWRSPTPAACSSRRCMPACELAAPSSGKVLTVPDFGGDITAAHARSCWWSWPKAGSNRAKSSSACRAAITSKCWKAWVRAKKSWSRANFLIDAESNLKAAFGGIEPRPGEGRDFASEAAPAAEHEGH